MKELRRSNYSPFFFGLKVGVLERYGSVDYAVQELTSNNVAGTRVLRRPTKSFVLGWQKFNEFIDAFVFGRFLIRAFD